VEVEMTAESTTRIAGFYLTAKLSMRPFLTRVISATIKMLHLHSNIETTRKGSDGRLFVPLLLLKMLHPHNNSAMTGERKTMQQFQKYALMQQFQKYAFS
jgi:hypothetical protein